MNERFSFEVPSEFLDEERWLNIFSTKQGIIAAISLLLVGGILRLFMAIGFLLVGILLALPIILFVAVLIFVPISEEQYLKGGGMMLDQLLYRLVLRRYYGCLYVKNYCVEKRRTGQWMDLLPKGIH